MNFQPYELKLFIKLLKLAASIVDYGYNLMQEGELTLEQVVAINQKYAETHGFLEELKREGDIASPDAIGTSGLITYFASLLEDEIKNEGGDRA